MSESPTTSAYPEVIDSWNFLTDKEDLAEVSDINKLKNAMKDVQTELGVAPSGSLSTVTDRLAMIQNVDGAIQKGTGFPSSGLVDGQMFYRTDENVLYVYNGSTWDSQGQSLSNVIFCWAGVDNATSGADGIYYGFLTTPAHTDGNFGNHFLFADEGGAPTLNFKFVKLAGIVSVTLHARLWSSSTSSSEEAILTVTIGSATAQTVKSVTSDSPAWYTGSTAIDVSGLVDGTAYDCTCVLTNETSNRSAYCSAITLIAS
jgi:hypothetical protein